MAGKAMDWNHPLGEWDHNDEPVSEEKVMRAYLIVITTAAVWLGSTVRSITFTMAGTDSNFSVRLHPI
jgi:hypothetical protein